VALPLNNWASKTSDESLYLLPVFRYGSISRPFVSRKNEFTAENVNSYDTQTLR